jgi:hypothetical protein
MLEVRHVDIATSNALDQHQAELAHRFEFRMSSGKR